MPRSPRNSLAAAQLAQDGCQKSRTATLTLRDHLTPRLPASGLGRPSPRRRPACREMREVRRGWGSRNAPPARRRRSVCGRLQAVLLDELDVDRGSGQDPAAFADVGCQGLAVSESATPGETAVGSARSFASTCRVPLRRSRRDRLLIEDWRLEYNYYRPHQSLSYQTRAEYARRWRTESQPELS
jgi:hypothetical protein